MVVRIFEEIGTSRSLWDGGLRRFFCVRVVSGLVAWGTVVGDDEISGWLVCGCSIGGGGYYVGLGVGRGGGC